MQSFESWDVIEFIVIGTLDFYFNRLTRLPECITVLLKVVYNSLVATTVAIPFPSRDQSNDSILVTFISVRLREIENIKMEIGSTEFGTSVGDKPLSSACWLFLLLRCVIVQQFRSSSVFIVNSIFDTIDFNQLCGSLTSCNRELCFSV